MKQRVKFAISISKYNGCCYLIDSNEMIFKNGVYPIKYAMNFFRKKGALFQRELYLPRVSWLREQVGDTIADGWSQFECNIKFFADMI